MVGTITFNVKISRTDTGYIAEFDKKNIPPMRLRKAKLGLPTTPRAFLSESKSSAKSYILNAPAQLAATRQLQSSVSGTPTLSISPITTR
jgi:hypothetical protein